MPRGGDRNPLSRLNLSPSFFSCDKMRSLGKGKSLFGAITGQRFANLCHHCQAHGLVQGGNLRSDRQACQQSGNRDLERQQLADDPHRLNLDIPKTSVGE